MKQTITFLGFFLFVTFHFSCVKQGNLQQTDGVKSNTHLRLEYGFQQDGYPTDAWITAIHLRYEKSLIDSLRQTQHEPNKEEQTWIQLIESQQSNWKEWIDSLAVPFKQPQLPKVVTIIIGALGGEDAFTYQDSTICFDVTRLQNIYGVANSKGNKDRINRFFAHEMTHILHKAWLKNHNRSRDTFLEDALWDCYLEGIGNYRSLSAKWVSKKGKLTPYGKKVMAELQPIFVERLLALEHATADEADLLMKNLSSGPFTKKWGALTCAIWLAKEAKGDDRRLQPWVERKAWGVLELAKRHLTKDLAQKLSHLDKTRN